MPSRSDDRAWEAAQRDLEQASAAASRSLPREPAMVDVAWARRTGGPSCPLCTGQMALERRTRGWAWFVLGVLLLPMAACWLPLAVIGLALMVFGVVGDTKPQWVCGRCRHAVRTA